MVHVSPVAPRTGMRAVLEGQNSRPDAILSTSSLVSMTAKSDQRNRSSRGFSSRITPSSASHP